MSTVKDPAEVLLGAAMLPPVEAPAGTKPKPARATQNRFGEINGFVDYTMERLTPTALKVWLVLWRDTKPNGLARTGQSDLARRSGVTDRAVRNALHELCNDGLLKVVRRGRAGAGPTTYRVRGVNPERTGVTGTAVPVAGGTGVPNSPEHLFRHPRRDQKRRPDEPVAAETTDVETGGAVCDN
ncbi:MAG TPA: helix-turn-helix domain-containing protein [Gemmata sp.]